MNEPLQVIVVGSGIAGMTYSTQLAAHRGVDGVRVRILSKAPVQVSNSFAAQGGVAVVVRSDDSFEQHIRDTLTTGAGRNDPGVVRGVVEEGPALIRALIGIGARFDRNSDGALHLAREGGHSAARVVHHQDHTGAEIVRVLQDRVLHEPAIEAMEGQRALELLVEGSGHARRVVGVRAIDLDSGDVVDRFAQVVVLATGGAGQVYHTTTNPISATGDGIALAARAGVDLRDMAFVQFHPTALHAEALGQAFLISEAVRGAGARLLKPDRSPLMEGVHPMSDLAPRHVVARAIHQELVRSGASHVWLDPTPIGSARFAQLFPSIAIHCRSMGYRPGIDLLPVRPAAHFMIGGVRTDGVGSTALHGLLALGECASSGLHGADRLASNSLLEALVIPNRAAVSGATLPVPGEARADLSHGRKRLFVTDTWAEQHTEELRMLMTRYAGIIRTHDGLRKALQWIHMVSAEVKERWNRDPWSYPMIDLRDMLEVSQAIVRSALDEPLSLGAHYWEEGEKLDGSTTGTAVMSPPAERYQE